MKRDPADVVDIELHQDLDVDSRLVPSAKQRVNGRQALLEPHINDTSAHRRDHPVIYALGSLT
jgi:hypothetical protein